MSVATLLQNVKDGYGTRIGEWSRTNYYRLARTTPLGRVHQQLRLRHHKRRYGVNSAFMFRSVEFEINSMCNRRCPYCPNVADRRPPGYMQESLFRKVVDELGSMGFDGRISYHFYGEPLLDKRLPRLVEYTTRVAPLSDSEIYSNGDFLTLEVFRSCLKVGVDNFLITQHDNCLPSNLQRILDSSSAEEKHHIAIRFAKDRYMINRSGLIKTLTRVDEPYTIPCDWPLTSIVITMTGNVVLCCNDYYETEVIGNVNGQTLRDIWTDSRFERYRSALSRGDRTVSKLCAVCDHVPEHQHRSRIVPS